jgi:hypothetical protein
MHPPTNEAPLPTKEYVKPLNQDFYDPDDEAKEFFKLETGIEDDKCLKDHILAVQAKAFKVCCCGLHLRYGWLTLYKIYPYPCIRSFGFMR